jgi:hypothetical protein
MVVSEQWSPIARTFRHLLRRLAQFRPLRMQSQLNQASGDFLLAATYENEGSISVITRSRSGLKRRRSR